MEKKQPRTGLKNSSVPTNLQNGSSTSSAAAISDISVPALSIPAGQIPDVNAVGPPQNIVMSRSNHRNRNQNQTNASFSNYHKLSPETISAFNKINTNNTLLKITNLDLKPESTSLNLKTKMTRMSEKLEFAPNSKSLLYQTTKAKNEEAIVDLRTRIPKVDHIFDIRSRIGNGTFSTVLLATLRKDRLLADDMRRKFAIKHHIPTSHPDRVFKEMLCLVKLKGENNVVGINCAMRCNESIAFVMPYMPHDRFHDFFGKMDLVELQHYMKNLMIALQHVHKYHIIHRDVKPSNFLYNRRKQEYLLVDFGLAQDMPQSSIDKMYEPINANNSTSTLTNPTPTNSMDLSNVCKRLREIEGATNDVSSSFNDLSLHSLPKRQRCNGPQGDEQTSSSATAVSNGQFKMPLKQINENGVGIVDGQPYSRLHDKIRSLQGHGNMTNVSITNTPVPNGVSIDTSASVVNKYNTNRNTSNANNTGKCFCYGNPQVCNTCLVKKEVHASRAGTPGYRPPEVLLKYPNQTTAVDMWAAGVIFLSVMSSVYPFFKAPNDYVALAEMVTIFGDKNIRKTAFVLDRLVTLSQRTKPLDLRKICVRFRNRNKFSSPELLKKYQKPDGSCEVCKNCDQFFFNCLCADSTYHSEPFDSDDPFPDSAYDLLYKLLEVNPHKRITAEEALQHPFFNDIIS